MGSETALLLPISQSDRCVMSGRLGGASAVFHCVQAARSSRAPVGPVVIAVAQDLLVAVEAGLAAQGWLPNVNVVPVDGDASRTACLRAAVVAMEQLSPLTTRVLVHDVHRPLASGELCARVIDALAAGNKVVIPALTMVDSVKAVDSGGSVKASVDRSSLRSAQFPRGLTLEVLREGLAEAEGGEFDEIQYVLSRRLALELVAGDPDAFLLDPSRNAAFAEAILACRLTGHR